MKRFIFCAIVGAVFSSCQKTEGGGGTAKIRGKVYVIDFFNDQSLIPDTIPALEEDVYIKYGSHDIIDDKNTTNQNGEYGFDYLRTGTYSIIAYSKNENGSGEDSAIVKTIKISGKKSTATVENIYLYKAKTGYASITGRLFAKDYNSTMVPKSPVDNYYSGGEDVYIQKEGSSDIIKKEVTSYDGTFVFSRLSKGKYTVYSYSKDTVPMAGSSKIEFSAIPIPSMVSCTIDSNGQQLNIPNLIIIK